MRVCKVFNTKIILVFIELKKWANSAGFLANFQRPCQKPLFRFYEMMTILWNVDRIMGYHETIIFLRYFST